MAEKFDFDQFEDAPEQGFDFDQFEDAPDQPKMEESPSRGMASFDALTQGLTFGFGDEISGATEAAGRAVGIKGLGAGIGEQEFVEPTLDSEQLLQAYREQRDRWRDRLEKGEEAFPAETMAADIAGGFATPGGAVRAAGRGALKLGGKEALEGIVKKSTAAGAATGAAETAGRTETDLTTMEGAGEVALGLGGGALLGGIGGKIAKGRSKDQLTKRAKDVMEQAEDRSLRAAGIKSSDMSDQIEKQVTTGKVQGPGVFALDEGIVDPFIKPKGAYKKAREVKNEIKTGYDRLTDQFKGISTLDNKQAREIADRNVRKITEGVESALAKTDDIGEAAENKIRKDLRTLKEELVQAYTSDNPVKNLQELYVKHNDKFFSNIKSPSGVARKQLRTELKNIQRDFAKAIKPESYDSFKQLDDKYTKILDLEQITKDTAGKATTPGGISDISRGIATEMVTKIPGSAGVVTGASIASKKFLDKDISSVAEAFKARQLLDKSRRLTKQAEDPGIINRAIQETPENLGVKATTAGAAAIDQEQSNEPYSKNKELSQYIESATPESLVESANDIRNQYGESGERLASTLEKVSQKDRIGRRALLFSLMQDPNNRRMLGLTEPEE